MKIICFSCKKTWRTDTSTREALTSCWGCLATYLEFHGNEHISWSVKNSGEYSLGARTKHVCDRIQYFWSHLLPILFLLLLLLLFFFFFFGGGGGCCWVVKRMRWRDDEALETLQIPAGDAITLSSLHFVTNSCHKQLQYYSLSKGFQHWT